MLNGFDSSYNVEGKERKIEANFRLYYNKTSSGDNGERETEQHLNERQNKERDREQWGKLIGVD